jgi:hypothetical protein
MGHGAETSHAGERKAPQASQGKVIAENFAKLLFQISIYFV